jgi:hypothetical protein
VSESNNLNEFQVIFFTRTVDRDSFLVIDVSLTMITKEQTKTFSKELILGFLVLPLFKDELSPITMPIYEGDKLQLQSLTVENFKL